MVGKMGVAMNKQGKVCFMVLLALLLTLSAVAQAALYVEGFLGGTAAGNLGGVQLPSDGLAAAPAIDTTTATTNYPR